MNAPLRSDAEPRLEDFPYRITDNVRYADLDPNQHVNNAVYASYFETGRVTLMKDRSRGLLPDGLSWMMVRLDMHFRAELRWPGGIEMGLGLVKFGRTSVTFDQVVFSQGKCVASGAVGQRSDRRRDAQADAADSGHRRSFSAVAAQGCRNRAAEILERDDSSSNRHPIPAFCLSVIFSEIRYTLFRIMR